MPANLENSAVAQEWKRSVFIPIPKKSNAKEYSNYHTVAFVSHASKVMLKILQARLQPYVNYELPDAQAGFRKGRGAREQMQRKIIFFYFFSDFLFMDSLPNKHLPATTLHSSHILIK